MKYLVIILLTVFSITAKSQIIYTPLSAGGYQMKYAKVDSGFALPVRDTSIGRGVDRPGLLTVQPTDSLIYYYTGKYWKLLRADSSANVTGKVDSITVSGNTVFYWTGGVGYGNPLPDIQVIQNTVDSSDVGFQDLAGSVHHLVILAPDGSSTGVGDGGTADRFGIEDSTSVQDRKANMGPYSFILTSGNPDYSGKISVLTLRDFYTDLYQQDNNSDPSSYSDIFLGGSNGAGVQLSSGNSASGDKILNISPSSVNIQRSINGTKYEIPISVNGNYADNTGNIQLSKLKITIQSTDPTTTDIPDGYSAVYKNSTSGLVYLWANIGGTLYKTQLN
jgi:hypothetical protein